MSSPESKPQKNNNKDNNIYFNKLIYSNIIINNENNKKLNLESTSNDNKIKTVFINTNKKSDLINEEAMNLSNSTSSKPVYIITIYSNTLRNLGGSIYHFIGYCFYRKFLEYKFFGFQKLSQTFYYPKKSEINLSIKNRNGYYCGAACYFLSQFAQINYDEIDEESSLIKIYSFIPKLIFPNNEFLQDLTTINLFSTVCLVFCYPLLLNSNNKAFNSGNHKKLINPRNIFQIYRKSFNRGICIFVLNGLIAKIPIINLFVCSKLESIRIAYIYGIDEKGLPYTSYRQAYNLITENNSIWKGNRYYNLMLIPYYVNFISELLGSHYNEEDDYKE